MYFGISDSIWAKKYAPLTDEHVPFRILTKTTDEYVELPPILSIAANHRPLKRNLHKLQKPLKTRYKIVTNHWLCAPEALNHKDKVLFVYDNGDIIHSYGDRRYGPEWDELQPILPDISYYFREWYDGTLGGDSPDLQMSPDVIEFVPHGSHEYTTYGPYKPYPVPSYCEFTIKLPNYSWGNSNKIPEEYRKDIEVFAIAGTVRCGWWSTKDKYSKDPPLLSSNHEEYVTIFWKSLIHFTDTNEFKEVILSKPIRIDTRGVSIYAEAHDKQCMAHLTIAGGGEIQLTGVIKPQKWAIDSENPEDILNNKGDVPVYNVSVEPYWDRDEIGILNPSPIKYINLKLGSDIIEKSKWDELHAGIKWVKAPGRIHTEECKNKLAPMFHPQTCNGFIYGGYYPIPKDIDKPENNIISDSFMTHANHHASWVYTIKNYAGSQSSIDIQGIIGGNIGTLEGGIMLPYSNNDVEIIGGMDHNAGTWLPENQRPIDIQIHLPHIEGGYLVPQPYSRIIRDSNYTYNTNILIRDCLYGTPLKIKSSLSEDLWVIPDSALAKSYSYPIPWTLIAYDKDKKLLCSDIPNTSCYQKQTQLDGANLPYLYGSTSLMQEESEEYRTFIWRVDLNIPDESERPHIEVTVLDWEIPHMYTCEDKSGVYIEGTTLYARSGPTEDIRI